MDCQVMQTQVCHAQPYELITYLLVSVVNIYTDFQMKMWLLHYCPHAKPVD